MPIEPGKCFAKCLIQEEAEKPQEVIQVTPQSEYKTTTNCGNRAKAGGFTEWRAVVCENKMNPVFIEKLQSALIDLDYKEGIESPNGKFDKETKIQLVKYQKANNLPIGQLDFSTLDHLGIDY